MARRVVSTLLVMIAIAAAQPDWHNPPGWRPAVPLDIAPGGQAAQCPQIACDGLGGVHIMYSAGAPGYCAVPYYVRSLDWGVHWELNDTLFPGTESHSPAILAQGDTVWAFCRFYSDIGPHGLVVRRSTDQGSTWSSRTLIANKTNSNWLRAAKGDGHLHLVCEFNSGSPYVAGSHSADGGGTWSDTQRLTLNGEIAARPSIAATGSIVHLTWTYVFLGIPVVYYNYSTDGGESWVHGQAGFPLSGSQGASDTSSVCVLGNHVTAAWTNKQTGFPVRVKFRHSSDGGANWDAEQDIAPGGGPAICCDGQGVHLVYVAVPSGETREQLFYRRSTDWGQTWSDPLQLTAHDTARSNPSLAADFQGRHIVFYGYATTISGAQPQYTQNDTLFPKAPDSLALSAIEDVTQPVPTWILTLTWNANSEPDIKGYKVYRAYEDGPFELVTPEPTNVTDFVDVVPPGTWSYFVAALDLAANEGPHSNVVSFSPPLTDFAIGESTPSVYLVGRSGRIGWGRGSTHDADLAERELAYRISGLEPGHPYSAGIVLVKPPTFGPTRVSGLLNGTRFLDRVELPKRPEMYVVTFRAGAERGSPIEFRFVRESGTSVAVSEIYVWSGQPRFGGQQSSGQGVIAEPVSVTRPARLARPPVELQVGDAHAEDWHVKIYDARGALVRVLIGTRGEAIWDGSDCLQRPVPTGVYVVETSSPAGRTRAVVTLVR